MESSIKAFVDRIEATGQGKERLAALIIQDQKGNFHTVHVPLQFLPAEIKEGEWLQITFTLDPSARDQTLKEVQDLLRELSEE